MNILFLIFLAAGLCYIAAFAFALAAVKRRGAFRGFLIFAAAGFVLQCGGIAMRLVQTKFASPFANPYELFEIIACIFVLADIVSGRILKIKFTELFTMPPAALLTILPLACPKFSSYMQSHAEAGGAFSYTLAIHASLAVLSYGALLFAAVFAAMALLQRRALKRKSADEFSSGLLPLPRLEKFTCASLGVSAAFMTLSMIAGIFAALSVPVGVLMTVKFLAGFILCAMQISLFISVARSAVCGAQASKLAILLFAVALLLLAPIELRNLIQ